MSRFYLGDSHSRSRSRSASPTHAPSSSDEYDSDSLPYPLPLTRADFLAPAFSPASYLSSLRNRHQTLEDLRSELRQRSQLLSKELLDLVNANYQDFLGLGRSLKSGDEKVEEVRVGLLGFRKEVESVKGSVVKREDDVRAALEERVRVRRQIAIGRALVDYEARVGVLEGRLMVESAGRSNGPAGKGATYDDSSDSDDEDSDDDEGAYPVSAAKLRENVQQYRLIQETGRAVGEHHPFVAAQAARLAKVRNTLILDLNTALQQVQAASSPSADGTIKIMRIYADMDESAEAVRVLKAKTT